MVYNVYKLIITILYTYNFYNIVHQQYFDKSAKI